MSQAILKRFVFSFLALFILSAGIRAQDRASLPHVEMRGKGPIQFVLIHCAGCDWRSWETFMERNRDRYTMHAVTLPGLGGTKPIAVPKDARGTPMLDAYAAGVARYIRENKLKKPVIVGHSMGAVVTLKIALDHPGLASKIFLVDWGAINPASLVRSEEEKIKQGEKRRAETLAMTDEAFSAQWSSRAPSMIGNAERAPVYADMFGKINRASSAQLSYEMASYDLRPRLHEIKIPAGAAWAIAADEKPEERRRQAQEVTRGLPNLQLVFFENTGHWIMEERIAEFDRLIADFVAGRKLK